VFHSVNGEKEKKGGKMEMVDLEKMHEKELYPLVETFLKSKKNCLSEYVGNELSLKRGKKSLRAGGVWSIKSTRKDHLFMRG